MNAFVDCDAERLTLSAEKFLLTRKLPEALVAFTRAQARGADAARCSAGRWTAHMLLGQFADAWRESDAMRLHSFRDLHCFWRGESIQGRRIMLRCLHGFGDAVQFLRFAPYLREQASTLIVEVPPKLFELSRFFDGVDEVITWGEQAPTLEPQWDVQIEIMELLYLFRTTCSDLPLCTRYLRLPHAVEKDSPADALHVGLVWKAGEWNSARCIPLSLLEPLLHIEHCVFWNLQGASNEVSAAMSEDPKIIAQLRVDDASRHSIAGLASLINRLDLVITVDTLAAHLAGALGVPAWVMLLHAADWRWMHERENSPWYPSLRLFRQPAPGDWLSVAATIQQALVEYAAKTRVETRTTNSKRRVA